MLVQNDFIKKLKDFGLNSYEAKIWVALLSRGVSTAGELSDVAGVPRSRSYDVLESLEKKGFIIQKLGKPIKYVALPPEEVVVRVKKKVEADKKEQLKMLDELNGSKILNELNLLHTNGIDMVDPVDISGALKGRNNIYDHLDLMIKESEKTIVLMTTAKGIIRKADVLFRNLKKANERGVKIRIVVKDEKADHEVYKKLSGIAQIRVVKDISARFCLVDGEQMTFMLMDDEAVHQAYDIGIWVNTPYFAKALNQMFELAWTNMKTLKH